MSYTSRHRYKNRREKNASFARKLKITVIIAILALIVYGSMNYVAIKDHLSTYFY